ncbi:MAG TPA: hypothetical protein VFX89_21370 [Gammaproteobacteria bacterium]|nr:hypothetical protein [Gammaproteobacteria bacterium]
MGLKDISHAILVDYPVARHTHRPAGSSAKEVIRGFAVIECSSREETVAHARRFLDIHRQILGKSYRADSEVRRLYGPWDAPPPRQG